MTGALKIRKSELKGTGYLLIFFVAMTGANAGADTDLGRRPSIASLKGNTTINSQTAGDPSEPDPSKITNQNIPASQIETTFQECVKLHSYQLNGVERSRLARFQIETRNLSALRLAGKTPRATDQQSLLIDEAIFISKTKPYLGLLMFRSLAQDRLREIIEKTISTDATSFKYFDKPAMTSSLEASGFSDSVIKQKAHALKNDLNNFYDKDPHLSAEDRDNAKKYAAVLLDYVARDTAQTQFENAANLEIGSQRRWGFLRQGTLAAGGALALFLAFKFSGVVVAAGEKLGRSLGFESLGELTAVASVGGVGGAGAASIERSYEVLSLAWVESQRHQTPYTCELQKLIHLESQKDFKSILNAGAFGMAAGTTLTGVAMISTRAARFVLFLVGGAVTVAFASEGYETVEDTLAYLEFTRLADEFNGLDAQPERLQALYQAHLHAQRAGAHAIDATIVGILFYALFVKGEFLHANKDVEGIPNVLAVSSDEMGPTAKAAAKIGSGALGIAADAADESATVAKMMALKVAALKAAATGAKLGVAAPALLREIEQLEELRKRRLETEVPAH